MLNVPVFPKALLSNCPSELGLELGLGGARIGVSGLDELENGRN